MPISPATVAPLRRSTRPRAPVSYVPKSPTPEEQEIYGLEPRTETQHDPTHCSGVGDVNPRKRLNSGAFSATGSDEEYISHPSKKKSKTLLIRNTPNQGMFSEQRGEAILRNICRSVGVKYSLFDDWHDELRSKDQTEMHIPYLPNELIVNIFVFCRSEVLIECEKACARFRSILNRHPGIWNRARITHYPGVDGKIPFGLSEQQLFKIAAGKRCYYCKSDAKSKAYYLWNTRSCDACIYNFTITMSNFKAMLRKKCDNCKKWTASRRAAFSDAIYWHRSPNFSGICWKEQTYRFMEEAEGQILEGKFDDWIKDKSPPVAVRWHVRTLEEWGASVPKAMAKDRRRDIQMMEGFNAGNIIEWCKRLPVPILPKVVLELRSYNRLKRENRRLTKWQFIHALPSLFKERDAYEAFELEKKHIRALFRIGQDSIVDRAFSSIIFRLLKRGSLTAPFWGQLIVETMLTAFGEAREVNFPKKVFAKKTSAKVMGTFYEWEPFIGWREFMRFIDLLECRLNQGQIYDSEELLHSSVLEFFLNQEDRIFVCPLYNSDCPMYTPDTYICKSHHAMTLREWAFHVFYTHQPRENKTRGTSVWHYAVSMLKIHPDLGNDHWRNLLGVRERKQRSLDSWITVVPSQPLAERVETKYIGIWDPSAGDESANKLMARNRSILDYFKKV